MSIGKCISISSLIFLSSTSFAQNDFRIEFSGGASLNSSSEMDFHNWDNGWSVGAGSAYRAGKRVEIAADVNYQRYPYCGGSLFLAFPAVVGLRSSVSGQATNVIEGSIAARIYASDYFISPFLSLRTGIYFMNIGEVEVSEWFDADPQNASHWTYHGTGVLLTKGFGALSLGVSIALGGGSRIMLEGGFTQTFDAEEAFCPIRGTIQVDL